MTEPTTPNVDTRIAEVVEDASRQPTVAVAAQVNVGEVHVGDTYNITINEGPNGHGKSGIGSHGTPKHAKPVARKSSLAAAPNSADAAKAVPSSPHTSTQKDEDTLKVTKYNQYDGDTVTIYQDGKAGAMTIERKRGTGELKITFQDLKGSLTTSSLVPGFSGYRDNPDEYGIERRSFTAEPKERFWQDPTITCNGKDGLDKGVLTNRGVDELGMHAVRNFMDRHPKIAEAAKKQGLPLISAGGVSATLDRIEAVLPPTVKKEVCPVNPDAHIKTSRRIPG